MVPAANELLLRSNDLQGGSGTLIDVDVARAGWEYTGLTVVRLASGESWKAKVITIPMAIKPTINQTNQSPRMMHWL